MDDGSDFLGVPTEVLEAIGRVVVAAGRVEGEARDIADALAVERADSPSFAPLTDAIKKALRDGPLPPWGSMMDPAELRDWIAEAKSLMDERSARLHSAYLHRLIEASWVPQRVNLRTGSAGDMTAADFRRLADRVARHSELGFVLSCELRLEVRPGVYYRPAQTREEAWALVHTPVSTAPEY